jgi:hypothetical protein
MCTGGRPSPGERVPSRQLLDNASELLYNEAQTSARRGIMTAIVCDVCKKAISGARKDVNYSVFLDREVCEPCTDQLLDVTKRTMKTRRPYTFKDYNDILVANLNQMTGR